MNGLLSRPGGNAQQPHRTGHCLDALRAYHHSEHSYEHSNASAHARIATADLETPELPTLTLNRDGNEHEPSPSLHHNDAATLLQRRVVVVVDYQQNPTTWQGPMITGGWGRVHQTSSVVEERSTHQEHIPSVY